MCFFRLALMVIAGSCWIASILSFLAAAYVSSTYGNEVSGCRFEYGWYCTNPDWPTRALQAVLNLYLVNFVAPLIPIGLIAMLASFDLNVKLLLVATATALTFSVVAGSILLVLEIPRVRTRRNH